MNIYDNLTEFNNALSFRSKATTLFYVMDKLIIFENILNLSNTASINRRINSKLDVDDVIFFDYCACSSVEDFNDFTSDKKLEVC